MSRLLPRLTYANVVASLALFVALGGTGYAALTLKPNSVKARQLAADSVGTSELRPNSVTSREVKNRSLRLTDFAANQLPAGAAGPAGPQGAQGAPGAKGDTGAQGPAGPTASAHDSSNDDVPIGATNSLDDSDQVEALITITAPSHLVATASARVFDNSSDGTADEVKCSLNLDDPPPAVQMGVAISREMADTLRASSTSAITVSATGRTGVLQPGTYSIGYHCLSPDEGATFAEGDLTIIAVGA